MIKKFLFVLTCLSLSFSSVSYALGTEALSIPIYKTQNEHYWKFNNNHWYYMNQNDFIQIGRFADEFGNIYETGNSSYIITSGYNKNGEYFNEKGELSFPYKKDSERYEELARRYENGETLNFKSAEDYCNFYEYYTLEYNLNKGSFSGQAFYKQNIRSFVVNMKPEYFYNRENLIEQIKLKFGPVNGDSDIDKIYDVCEKLKAIEYDLNYTELSLSDTLKDNKGVCWQYSNIAYVLLNDVGVQTELCNGKYQNEWHKWIRCKIDNRWVYVDPTAYVSTNERKWLDIPYEEYAVNYQLLSNNEMTYN